MGPIGIQWARQWKIKSILSECREANSFIRMVWEREMICGFKKNNNNISMQYTIYVAKGKGKC